eukprot:TRINITY_DN62135_c0_g1_i1.p1 TRINITY_DN62135_c0_g1~~TRINITY_DN62135_c0_g1_i1.p1  ORF type:complete len:559 (+),score=130.23 TRINITY_DN62135_c0_g1_i1:79-1755(+)
MATRRSPESSKAHSGHSQRGSCLVSPWKAAGLVFFSLPCGGVCAWVPAEQTTTEQKQSSGRRKPGAALPVELATGAICPLAAWRSGSAACRTGKEADEASPSVGTNLASQLLCRKGTWAVVGLCEAGYLMVQLYNRVQAGDIPEWLPEWITAPSPARPLPAPRPPTAEPVEEEKSPRVRLQPPRLRSRQKQESEQLDGGSSHFDEAAFVASARSVLLGVCLGIGAGAASRNRQLRGEVSRDLGDHLRLVRMASGEAPVETLALSIEPEAEPDDVESRDFTTSKTAAPTSPTTPLQASTPPRSPPPFGGAMESLNQKSEFAWLNTMQFVFPRNLSELRELAGLEKDSDFRMEGGTEAPSSRSLSRESSASSVTASQHFRSGRSTRCHTSRSSLGAQAGDVTPPEHSVPPINLASATYFMEKPGLAASLAPPYISIGSARRFMEDALSLPMINALSTGPIVSLPRPLVTPGRKATPDAAEDTPREQQDKMSLSRGHKRTLFEGFDAQLRQATRKQPPSAQQLEETITQLGKLSDMEEGCAQVRGAGWSEDPLLRVSRAVH